MDNNGQQPATQTPTPQDQTNPTPDAPIQGAPLEGDDEEWAGATAEFVIDKGATKPVEKKDEQTKPGEGSQETPKAQGDPNGEKPNAEQGNGNDPQKGAGGEEASTYTPPTREEIEVDRKQTITEVREALYPDLPTRLEDADGEPIETIEDVQKLMNPNTGKAFTAEEAGAWLLAAQKYLNTKIKEAGDRSEQVAEVHLSLKDQASRVKAKWGDLLAANPNGIREKVYAAYQKTLKMDEAGKLIVDAPVSMEEHYDLMLEPYERLAAKMEADADKEEQDKKAGQQKQVQQQKQNSRSDRADIIGTGQKPPVDAEDAEWGDAMKNYYEN